MDPLKIIGGILILLGVIFRAISLHVLSARAKFLPDDPKAHRRHASQKRNALMIDYAFIILGVYTLVMH